MAKHSIPSRVEIFDESERSRVNRQLISVIVNELKGRVEQGNGTSPIGYDYILGQTIRQYKIASKNWHNSVAAVQFWKISTTNDIRNFDYKQVIEITCEDEKQIETYKGNSRGLGSRLCFRKGNRVFFNKIYIAEHTIPVSDIREALIKVYEISKDKTVPEIELAVKSILEKMHITRMLKKEDRQLSNSSNRLDPSIIIEKNSDEVFHLAAKQANYPPIYSE